MYKRRCERGIADGPLSPSQRDLCPSYHDHEVEVRCDPAVWYFMCAADRAAPVATPPAIDGMPPVRQEDRPPKRSAEAVDEASKRGAKIPRQGLGASDAIGFEARVFNLNRLMRQKGQ